MSNCFSLRCGDVKCALSVPDSVQIQVAELQTVQKVSDGNSLIRQALNHPIGSPRIEEMVRPGQKVCIISDDNTRMTPVAAILDELLLRLEIAGIRRDDIVIVMALGSHRYMTETEMIRKVGQSVFEKYRVLNSEFENPDMLMEVGKSQLGTPILAFKPAMEADIRIGIGNVVPHGCMGWSGGAKILYPGITSADIVSEFHVMQGLCDEILLGMTEAPTRLAVEKWTQNIGLHFIINTVLDKDLDLYRVVAGHYVQAHRRAVQYAQEVFSIRVPKQPDIILSAAYPISLDCWQCTKAIYAPGKIVRPGGDILLLADCAEGVGPHPQMLEYMSLAKGKESLMARIQKGETGEDLLAMAVGVSVGKIVQSCSVTMASDHLTEEECTTGGMRHSSLAELQNTLNQILSKYENPFLLVIPEGGESVPVIQ